MGSIYLKEDENFMQADDYRTDMCEKKALPNAIHPKDEIDTDTICSPFSCSISQYIYLFIKRCLDIILSSIALILLSPLFLTVPVLIKLDSHGPGYYRQQRIGKNGRPFIIYKFRSMCNNADTLLQKLTPEQWAEYNSNYKLKADFRITKIGGFLRKTNIDELPQLLNIFAGQLSFIGPRPVVQKETEKYGVHRDLFLSVTPGLTGYWQVHRKPDTTYEQRIEMELYYIRNRTLAMDIRLLFQTVTVLFHGAGSSSAISWIASKLSEVHAEK